MSVTQLRREIKKAIDRLPVKQLESVSDFVHFLNRPSIAQRLSAAQKAIASAKGVNWRKVPVKQSEGNSISLQRT